MSEAPKGYQYYIDGLYYKIGVHNKVFIFMYTQWVKSQLSVDELMGLVNLRKGKEQKVKEKQEHRRIKMREAQRRYKAKLKAQKDTAKNA